MKPGQVSVNDRGWASRPLMPPRIGDAVFALATPQQVAAPVNLKGYGWLIIRYEEERPALVDWDTVQREAFVREVKQRGVLNKLTRDVEAKYAVQLVRENVGPVKRVFSTLVDSLSAGTQPAAPMPTAALGIDLPLSKLTPEERALPLIRWSGGVWTIEDYVRSLADADPPFWPSSTTSAKIEEEITNRMYNWAWLREARASEIPTRPDFVAEMRREHDRLLLDRYYDDHLQQYGAGVTDEDVAQYFEAHRDDYRTGESVTYGCLRFPANAHELALRAEQMLEQGAIWETVGIQMRATDPRVTFDASIGPTSGRPYPAITAVALQHDVLPDGSPNLIPPQQIDDEWVILNVTRRSYPQAVDLDLAGSFVRRDLERMAMEESLVAKLDELSKRFGLKVDYDLALKRK
jgi:hypothetical protein